MVGRPSVKSVAEDPEGALENGDTSIAIHASPDEVESPVEDDEDRRTIQGVVVDGESVQEGKTVANGLGVNDEARQGPIEKPLHATTTPLPTVNHSAVVSNVG